MELLVTFCDRCNGDCDPMKVMELSQAEAAALGLPPWSEVSRGIAWMPEKNAIEDCGWKETDQGTLCPVCISEVNLEAATEIGLDALTNALAKENE